jgi:hypothetical protein
MLRQYVKLPRNRIGLYFEGEKDDYMSMTPEQRGRIKNWFKWDESCGLWVSRKWNAREIALKAALDLGFTERPGQDPVFNRGELRGMEQ